MNTYEFEIRIKGKIVGTRIVSAENNFEAKGKIARIIAEGNYPLDAKIGEMVSTTDPEILEYYEEVDDLVSRHKDKTYY